MPWTATGQTSCKTGKTPDADRSKHEMTSGKTGNLWRKVMSWFGYGCGHQARDPGSLQRPQASRAETKELDGDKLETPVMRCKDFSADRGQRAGKAVRPARCTRLM